MPSPEVQRCSSGFRESGLRVSDLGYEYENQLSLGSGRRNLMILHTIVFDVCMCIYIYIYVCMYVCMYVRMYVYINV